MKAESHNAQTTKAARQSGVFFRKAPLSFSPEQPPMLFMVASVVCVVNRNRLRASNSATLTLHYILRKKSLIYCMPEVVVRRIFDADLHCVLHTRRSCEIA